MSKLTFKDYLCIMEDAEQDLARIMAEISAIDVQLAQRTAPLIARKNMLTKQALAKQKQAGQGAQQSNQPMQATTTTTTPGSAGASTPGGGAPQV